MLTGVLWVGYREDAIRRIQAEYNYSYEDAEKMLEIHNYKTASILFNSACGVFAARKVAPFQKELAAVHPLFRKAWMKYPVQLAAFGGTYYCASKLTQKLFPRLSFMKYYRPRDGRAGISPESYQDGHDLVAKFRVFENQRSSSLKDEYGAYLDAY